MAGSLYTFIEKEEGAPPWGRRTGRSEDEPKGEEEDESNRGPRNLLPRLAPPPPPPPPPGLKLNTVWSACIPRSRTIYFQPIAPRTDHRRNRINDWIIAKSKNGISRERNDMLCLVFSRERKSRLGVTPFSLLPKSKEMCVRTRKPLCNMIYLLFLFPFLFYLLFIYRFCN